LAIDDTLLLRESCNLFLLLVGDVVEAYGTGWIVSLRLLVLKR
jgi:hypothetical protein